MLQIRLSNKPATETGGIAKPLPVDNVTVACPDHLVLADLPVAKSLGTPSAAAVTKTVGHRSRHQLGERVHFCVRCDLPIAIYGRLIGVPFPYCFDSPCEHAFCLDCARSDSLCYLCDDRIQKIQTIKMMEGIFVCAAPHCLKSFLKKTEFESHINETHTDLIHPNKEKEVNEPEVLSTRKSLPSDSTVQEPPRPLFSPSSDSQVHDHEDKIQRPQSRDQSSSRPAMNTRSMPPFTGQAPNNPSEQQPDNNQSQSFDRSGSENRFPLQAFDMPGLSRQDSGKQIPVMAPTQFGKYPSDGVPQFFGASYDTTRPDSTPDPGSLLGFPTGPAGPINFAQNYPQPWNMGLGSVPLEPPMMPQDSFMNIDPQGRGLFQGDYRPNTGIMHRYLPPSGMEQRNFVDPRDGKGVLARQPMPLPPPPPLPSPIFSQPKRGRSYSGDGNYEALHALVGSQRDVMALEAVRISHCFRASCMTVIVGSMYDVIQGTCLFFDARIFSFDIFVIRSSLKDVLLYQSRAVGSFHFCSVQISFCTNVS